jgi:hypothetical protein
MGVVHLQFVCVDLEVFVPAGIGRPQQAVGCAASRPSPRATSIPAYSVT